MDASRTSLLEKYFDHHGLLANQDVIFQEVVIDELSENNKLEVPNENDIEYIRNRESYNFHVNGKESFDVPMMNSRGFFIIDGVEKVPLIQENKSRNSMFVTSDDGEITCETKFPNSRNSLKVVYSKDIYIRIITGDNTKDRLYISSLLRKWNMNSTFIDMDNEEIKDDLYNYFIENIIGSSSKVEVVRTIEFMLYKCTLVLTNREKETDRDHYGYKTFQSSGNIISSLIRRAMDKKTGKIKKRIEDELYSVMRTGLLRVRNVVKSKMVIQVGSRSELDRISSIRRITMSVDENSTSFPMRQIHETQVGFICISETPEGKQTGLIKNLASTCIISSNTRDVYNELLGMVSQESDPEKRVVYNGVVIGFKNDSTIIGLHELKKNNRYLSFHEEKDAIYIRTWTSRLMRPLIKTCGKVINWDKLDGKSWNDLVSAGLIEYLDPLETSFSKIAQTSYGGEPENYTHMEIHPCTMFGIPASSIPYINHNHGARAIFASSMVKQALQAPPIMDRDGKFLLYSQRPLVDTTVNRIIGTNPNGINVLTCIMSYSGYNQEDAIIMKKSFAERGGFMSINNKIKRLDKQLGDRVVINTEKNMWVIDGINEKVVNTYKADSLISNTEVMSSEVRFPQIGDKFASRHAQKGVLGMLMPEEDMPFMKDGTIPDILINPHGIPSRMTMGQMIEGIEGRKCVITGTFKDGTPFQDVEISKLREEKRHVMMCGMTGEIMESLASIDIVYYMPLAHQVADKIYIRSTGPRSELSHQPVSGKNKGGGLRFGEMEMDLLIAHGASELIRDITNNSDIQEFDLCTSCGIFPSYACCDERKIEKIRIPYSLKVLRDVMLTKNIDVRIDTSP